VIWKTADIPALFLKFLKRRSSESFTGSIGTPHSEQFLENSFSSLFHDKLDVKDRFFIFYMDLFEKKPKLTYFVEQFLCHTIYCVFIS